MQEAEASPPGAKGLLCLPYFSGERTPIHDPHARGVFFGLNLLHTRGDLFRAALEGIAMATRHVTETYAEAGAAPTRVMAVGGGTKMTPLAPGHLGPDGPAAGAPPRDGGGELRRHLPRCPRHRGGASEDIDAWNPPERVVPPRDLPEYARSYPLFRRLYEQTKDIMRELP
jgi:xylulokinase